MTLRDVFARRKVSAARAAEVLHVEESTVYRWIAEKTSPKLPDVLALLRAGLITARDLREMARSGESEAA